MRTFSEWIKDIRDNQTNGSMATKISDEDGDIANIDNKALVQIDYIHNKIHQGAMFDADKVFLSVANNTSSYMCIKSTTREVHLTIAISTEGTCYVNSYIDTTYTDCGTQITAFNRKIDDGSEASPTAEVYHTPTIEDLGTQRYEQLLPGGSRNFAQGGSGSSRIETILYPGKELLVEITNVSGSTIDQGVVFEWYEEID